MGTSIELEIGGLSLSYSKNHIGLDFGYLFQSCDLTSRKGEGISYDYHAAHPDERADLDIAEQCFARPLSRILPRLTLLGYSLDTARAEYEAITAEAVEMSSWHEPSKTPDFLTFDQFCMLASRYPLSSLSKCIHLHDDHKAMGHLGSDADFKRLPGNDNSDSFWSEISYFGAQLAILSAQSMLMVFALNPANADIEVTWKFGPLVSAGWEPLTSFVPDARRKQKILIATEGASDARIIKRALNALRPDVADFFNFVDVDERHHFWGTGNLVRFAEGLLRIDVLNKVLFVFDNDAEGVEALRKLEKLNLPANMRGMIFPSLPEFTAFAARGPEGVREADINGRAAAIECYLDLKFDDELKAEVTWSNYKKEIDAWHGALNFKESYAKHFYGLSDDDLSNGSYDVSKLLKLVDAIIQEASLVLDNGNTSKMELKFVTKTIAECSPKEIKDFCDLVCTEGQVNLNSLLGNVKKAEKVCFAYNGARLIGVAAIKNASDRYRASIMRKSGTKGALDNVVLEFGYVVVSPDHRRKGISKLMAEALEITTYKNMFATSLTDNKGMHRTLSQFGFNSLGVSYPSTQHAGQDLMLFVRSELSN